MAKSFAKREKKIDNARLADLRFVKFGEFTKTMLLWYSPIEGYFVTRPDGSTMNGRPNLPQQTVEMLAYASK